MAADPAEPAGRFGKVADNNPDIDHRQAGDHQEDAPAHVRREMRHHQDAEHRWQQIADTERGFEQAGEGGAGGCRDELRDDRVRHDERRGHAEAGQAAQQDQGRVARAERGQHGAGAEPQHPADQQALAPEPIGQAARRDHADRDAERGGRSQHADLRRCQVPKRLDPRQDDRQRADIQRFDDERAGREDDQGPARARGREALQPGSQLGGPQIRCHGSASPSCLRVMTTEGHHERHLEPAQRDFGNPRHPAMPQYGLSPHICVRCMIRW